MNARIDHPTDRPNFAIVYIGDFGSLSTHIGLAFSYETVIGIALDGFWKVRENEWGPTTGKHLNYLDNGNKTERLSSGEFAKVLESLKI